jgi:hypothetical protein
MSTPAYVPRFKRPGVTVTPTSMPKDFQTPKDAAASELKAIGFVEGSGGQLYYPEKHPHVHIGIGTDTFMAYSEGEQHLGGYGISMYRNKALQKGYTTGVAKMKQNYGDDVGPKLNQAAGILKLFDKA